MRMSRTCRAGRSAALLRWHPIVALLVAACASSHPSVPDDSKRVPSAAPSDTPLAPFARMIDGEWRVTFESGTTQFDRWEWGPGRRSILSQAYGTDAAGAPWRVLTVYYAHPESDSARAVVRVLSAHPEVPTLGWGLSEGRVVGSGAARIDSRLTLRQSGAGDRPRDIETRWEFESEDRYRATLLEERGSGYIPLVEWTYDRSRELSALPPVAAEADTPSERFAFFAPLVERPQRFATTAGATPTRGATVRLEATFEWIPHVMATRIRVAIDAEKSPLGRRVDIYLMRAADPSTIRVLAVCESGAVYEGVATATAGATLEAMVRSQGGERAVDWTVRVARDDDGSLRARLSSDGADAQGRREIEFVGIE